MVLVGLDCDAGGRSALLESDFVVVAVTCEDAFVSGSFTGDFFVPFWADFLLPSSWGASTMMTGTSAPFDFGVSASLDGESPSFVGVVTFLSGLNFLGAAESISIGTSATGPFAIEGLVQGWYMILDPVGEALEGVHKM